MKNIKKEYYFLLAVAFFLAIIFATFLIKKESRYFYYSGSGQNKLTIIEESNLMGKSQDSNWWLNSGGIMNVLKSEFSTNTGKLSKDSRWRKAYAKNNSRDTDNGYYPQNIFRLVTREKYKNETQSMYFYIEKINLSESSYRNESNGVLFFNRYRDGDNLYYAGLRVDGAAVIKKKIDGKYYVLAQKKILTSGEKYDRIDNPNLLPINTWVGIKSEVKNIGDEKVDIKLYMDKEGKGDWQLILEAKDKKDKYGKAPLEDAGYGGIRTDFMDVKFRDYTISED